MVRNRALQISVLLWIIALSAVALSGLPKPTTVAKPDVATRILEDYLRSGETVPANAVVRRHVLSANKGMDITMQMVQDEDGRRRMTLLKPLAVQGQIAVDDGEVFATFCPDTRRYLVVPSPRLMEDDISYRVGLVKQNYSLAVEQNVDIAGRLAYVVVAVPKAEAMPIRKISVDSKTSVLLRVEAIQPQGNREILFDTQAITFPDTVDPAQFDVEPAQSVRKITYPRPEPLERPEDALALVGFQPIIPQQLPYGFVVRGIEAGGISDGRFVAARITDGVVTASVYQWNADSKVSPLGRDTLGLDRIIDGIGFRILGEVSPQVRLTILETIANERGKTFRLSQEQRAQADALTEGVDTRIRTRVLAPGSWRIKQQP